MTPEEREQIIDKVAREIYEIVRIELRNRGIETAKDFNYAARPHQRRLRANTEVLLKKMGVIPHVEGE